tara:strand:+ start:1434 stop:1859 length:426 start_codon:yes stop_codon:yes gene_type:complete
MALTFSSFESFDEVVAHYENVKPLRGKDNAGKDIRPIGDRKRKNERIVKISDNCYALSEGYHFGDALFNWGWGYVASTGFVPTLKDMEKYAPIVCVRNVTAQNKSQYVMGMEIAHTTHVMLLYTGTHRKVCGSLLLAVNSM